jgi:hypothetical protein
MLVAVLNSSGSGTSISGWTQLYQSLQVTIQNTCAFYKLATGSEGSSVTVSCTNGRIATLSYRISHWDSAQAPQFSTVATGTSGSPDPASLTTSWASQKNLFLAVAHYNNGPATGYPAGYTGDNTNTGTGANNAAAHLQYEGQTQNPGSFAVPFSGWAAYTIGIRGGT